MPRYVDADALFEKFEDAAWYDNCDRDEVAECLLLDAPTADVHEVRHGWWNGYTTVAFRGIDDFGDPIYRDVKVWKCSECSRKTVVKEKYCPNCGAMMDGKNLT